MQETTVFTYRVSLSKTEWAKASKARRAAGDLWTRLVKINRFCRRRQWPWPTDEDPTESSFQTTIAAPFTNRASPHRKVLRHY